MQTIGLLIYPGMQALDVTGPMDVFAAANQCAGDRPQTYRLCTIGLEAGAVSCESGLKLLPDTTLAAAPELDTLVIPGGRGSRVVNANAVLLDWIRARASRTRRVVSICTGLYVFAATGLLEGCRVTTHWQYAADVRRRHPGLRMDADQMFVRDGKYYTSGGLTAGIDLALALVEEDLGSSVALAVARELVMYMKRPGNQAQFSAPLDAQTRASGRMSALVAWLLDHLDQDLSVERLADHLAMSERNFRRVFAATFDTTPAEYIERLRLERACVLLTTGTLSVERIAAAVGFASADSFRRAFRACYLTSPKDYRERFGG